MGHTIYIKSYAPLTAHGCTVIVIIYLLKLKVNIILMYMKINLGCGYLNRELDEIGIDNNHDCKPDILWDLNTVPYPVENESVDSIKAIHVLEHIPNIVGVMNECYRILKRGGEMLIRVPLFPTLGSLADPTHVRYFIPSTFDYFTEKGKLTGLKNTFEMGNMVINNLTDDTQEIVCILKKE
jgi:SAM-dependent methyltransferase